MKHYPELNEREIKLVYKLFETYPTYFESEECPYSEEVKDIFRGNTKAADYDQANGDAPDLPTVEQQVVLLGKQLKEYGEYAMNDDDATPSDKNTYFRMMAALSEKQLAMLSEIYKLKDVELFYTRIIDFVDREMDATQRATFIDYMNGASNYLKEGLEQNEPHD